MGVLVAQSIELSSLLQRPCPRCSSSGFQSDLQPFAEVILSLSLIQLPVTSPPLSCEKKAKKCIKNNYCWSLRDLLFQMGQDVDLEKKFKLRILMEVIIQTVFSISE